MPDLKQSPMRRAFAPVISILPTRLSTGSVGNPASPVSTRAEEVLSMKTPWNLSRYLPIAQRFIARGRLPALLLAVTRKSASQGGRLGTLKAELRVLLALCSAWWRGEYPGISKQAMLSVVAALLYFLSPIDAIP